MDILLAVIKTSSSEYFIFSIFLSYIDLAQILENYHKILYLTNILKWNTFLKILSWMTSIMDKKILKKRAWVI